MSLTDEQQFQLATYGQLLAGEETELDLARMARIQFLKKKMRPRLAAAIGDTPDNLTDAIRAVVLGDAIQAGLVTDQQVIDQYKTYLQSMLDGYGGAEAILSVLSANTQAIGQYLVAGYYLAKSRIMASEDIEEIRFIDIDGQP